VTRKLSHSVDYSSYCLFLNLLSRETNIPAITPRNNIIANTIPRIAGIDRAVCDAAGPEPDVGSADVVEGWEEVGTPVLAVLVDEAR
jgi:hypothetical protein